MSTSSPLDNPIWHALHTEHGSLAVDAGLARRYPSSIGPLSGMASVSPASLIALHNLASPGSRLVLFLEEPLALPAGPAAAGWVLDRADQMCQMVADGSPPAPTPTESLVRRLAPADVPQMLELAQLTNPGPFRERTLELGAFFGIFDDGKLLAMAGQRLHLPRFVEVSGVCTHPQARGRGYARALISVVMREIRAREKAPILHVLAANHEAIRIYRALGFAMRRTLHLSVLRNPL
ncbi:MAG TPA: GNAT family N-acetyltransferase [Terracidiphilus sp.]|nr:GNAT family N-acetyltransferase [Terracidiphilus sp.]